MSHISPQIAAACLPRTKSTLTARATTARCGQDKNGGLYRALGLKPAATDDELTRAIDEKIAVVERCARRTSGEWREKLERAVTTLRRLRSLACDARWRTEYDFRHGFVRARERIRAADDDAGLPLDELRRIWRRAHPADVVRAALYFAQGDESGLEVAAMLDPFHPLAVWRHREPPEEELPLCDAELVDEPPAIAPRWDGGTAESQLGIAHIVAMVGSADGPLPSAQHACAHDLDVIVGEAERPHEEVSKSYMPEELIEAVARAQARVAELAERAVAAEREAQERARVQRRSHWIIGGAMLCGMLMGSVIWW